MPNDPVCACVFVNVDKYRALSLLCCPLCQRKNQSTCQPLNTFGLLRCLSAETRVFVCVFCHSVNLASVFVFFFLSVCPAVFHVPLAASDLHSPLYRSYLTPSLKNESFLLAAYLFLSTIFSTFTLIIIQFMLM